MENTAAENRRWLGLDGVGETLAVPREPFEHSRHVGARECGCAKPGESNILKCSCGALYRAAVVVAFPVWRCYDCGRRLRF